MIELQDETPLNRQSQCSIHLLTYEANSIFYCLTLSYSLPSIPTILIKLEFEWAFSMFINQNARSRKSKWSGNILNCWLMTAATLEGVKLRRDEAVLETRGFNLPRLRQQDHILSGHWNEAHNERGCNKTMLKWQMKQINAFKDYRLKFLCVDTSAPDGSCKRQNCTKTRST